MAKTSKTIKVELSTHTALLEVVSRLQLERHKRVTLDETIRELIKHSAYSHNGYKKKKG